MKQTFILLLILLSNLVYSQTSDDFEDGNFTENPQWTGNQSLFKVNSLFQLQLNDTEENQAYLGTANAMLDNTEWRCWIKLAFSPSANNYARYYLVSDQQDLLSPLNGYFLQFGESGSNDAVELFRQDGDEFISVCRGAEGVISTSFEIRVKVTRDGGGSWKLYVDQSGGEDFVFEAEGVDNIYTQTSRIGFLCKYTSSNSTKMYFDDVYAGPFIIDNEPPILISIAADTDSTAILQFNELLNEGSVGLVNNYLVDDGIGNPAFAFRDEMDASMVKLKFDNKFELGKNYLMSVAGVKDLAENLMNPLQMEFNYYKTQPFDVVINEIMSDPTPPVALPDYEYLELYNKTQSNIDLDRWTLTIGTTNKMFSSVILPAQSYLIVAKEAAQEQLGEFGQFYGFSTFTLTNSGQTLVLSSNDNLIISKVSYTDSWYNNPEKEEGGWSLEQKNSANVCSGSENWTASVDGKGGTPGAVNSVVNNLLLVPAVSRLEVVNKNTLQLYFNQSMDEVSLNNPNAYIVDGSIGNPEYIFTFDDKPNKVELYFTNEFAKGIVYELLLKKNLSNCMQLNMESDTTIYFGLPDDVLVNDVIINEILFNPWTNGVDYVELFNRSNSIIDLSTLKIGSIKESPPNPSDTTSYNIVNYQYLLMPYEFVALTISPDIVKNQYFTSSPNALVKVDPFPAYNNDDGRVLLTSFEDVVIDSLNYTEEMQFPLLVYYDGVALERINPDVSSSDINNWHSAAESVGFGTPGYKNSQYVSNISTNDEVVIEPEIFSPDNDGVDDVINIKYKFDTPGYVMSITVFNAGGYPIRKLTNNDYLGTEGSVSWDGIQDDNSKAPVGIYIFFITVYDIDGNVKKYKKTGVLATKL
ncbi:MAG: lamin tail domain-containing protein [Bacteroidota bacterium]